MEKLLNNFKICFTKGDTYALAVKIKEITDDLNSAYFSVKENPEDDPLILKSLGAGIDKIDDRAYKNEKTYKIQLQSEDSANLEPLVQYMYDFRVAVGNVVKTLLSGVFVVTHSISEVSTTATETLEAVIDDTVESELSTTSATSGIEYEQDPVANAKIGDLTALTTTAKETIVKSINETVTKNTAVQAQVNKILDGTTTVPKATKATNATNAENAENAENATNATNSINSVNTENTDFTNAEWSASVSSVSITAGLYQILIADTYTCLLQYNGSTLGFGGGAIVNVSDTNISGKTIYFIVRTPKIADGGILTVASKQYAISDGGTLTIYDNGNGNENFKYRKIR